MPEAIQYKGFKLEPGDISILTFNQKINIFSSAVLKDFTDALSGLLPKTKVLVIAAEGATFLAGADIKEMSQFSRDEAMDFAELSHRAMNTVEGFPGPAIAGVNA